MFTDRFILLVMSVKFEHKYQNNLKPFSLDHYTKQKEHEGQILYDYLKYTRQIKLSTETRIQISSQPA